ENNPKAAESDLNSSVVIFRQTKNRADRQSLLKLTEELESACKFRLSHNQANKGEPLAKTALYVITTMPDAQYNRDVEADCLNLLGRVYVEQKKYTDSLEALKKAITSRKVQFADEDWEVAELLDVYHDALLGSGRQKEASQLAAWLYKAWPKSAFKDSDEWSR